VNDVATLLQIVVSLVAITAPIILIVFVIAGVRRVSLVDLFVLPAPDPWPKGVQEVDCPRWEVKRLEPRDASPRSCHKPCPKPANGAEPRRSRSTTPSRAS
jgi:hypothetical protein